MNDSKGKGRWILLSVLLLLQSSGIQVVSAETGYACVSQWGGFGSGDGQLNSPQGIALDSNGSVYVADMNNNRIQKFDSTGKYLLQWGSAGSGDGQFNGPSGIAVDNSGTVYVTDSRNNRIQAFTSTGGFLVQWNGSESRGGQFNQPLSIAVDGDGGVYVADTYNRRVLKYNQTGAINRTWSCSGTFSDPAGIAVDRTGDLYVSDLIANTVQEFDPAGVFIRRWNGSESGTRFYGPCGITAGDDNSTVLVTDILNDRVLKFTSTGDYLMQWNGTESEAGRFSRPQDVEVDSHGAVYVTDSNNNRIVKFRPHIPPSIANFTANLTNGTAPLAVLFTDLSTNNPKDWSWSFGDNTTSTVQSPVHAYTAAGNFTVTLKVANAGGENTTVRAGYITVSAPVYAPVANFTADVTNGTAPLPVRFIDRSTNNPVMWSWSFGDGNTSSEENPVHTYAAAGNYTVTLTVANAGGENTTVGTDCIIVNPPVPPTPFQTTTIPTTVRTTAPKTTARTPPPTTPPTTLPTTLPQTTTVTLTPTATTEPVMANFTTNGTVGTVPLAVQFIDLTTGPVRQYFWQFGDGGASFDRNPVHLYTTPGRYTVSLIAIGSSWADVRTIERYITVTAPVTTAPAPTSSGQDLPPVADFAVITLSGAGSTGIRVIDTSTDAAAVHYALGDGTTTDCRNFTYIYWEPGTYTLTQIATNDAGSSQKTVAVTVPAMLTPTPIVSPGSHTIPGTLQAEDYDPGGEEVAYHDTTPGNEGGVYRHDDVDIEQFDTDGSPNVGWIRSGEWLAYTVNISTAGTYNAGFRVASAYRGSSVQVLLDDGTTSIATVTVPNTGGWQVFRTVPVPVTLPAGEHRLKLSFPADYVNINWVSFTRNDSG